MVKSKNIIAALGVVAGLGVAFAPLAHATTLGTDTLHITIDASCTLAQESAALGPEGSYTAWEQTYTKTMGVNDIQVLEAPASNAVDQVKILCNEAGGYQITGTGTDLTKGEDVSGTWTAHTSPNDDKIEPGTPAQGSAYWGVKLDAGGSLAIQGTYASAWTGLTGAVVAKNTSVSNASGDTFTIVSYKASTKVNQKSGHYEGTATYALTHPIAP